MFILLPGMSWCAREKAKAIMASAHQAAPKKRAPWPSVATQLQCWGNSLIFCLGFCFFELPKHGLQVYAERHPNQGGGTLVLTFACALLAFLISSSIFACSDTK